ncbi:MAG TPA: ABC transporter permease [Gemmataceae bacterium]|jgi:phospholipid/cholesterol/gamma-HCH transport system permease protein|nr:ABC transporter permease [Gemmataceae bacterium]
MAEHVVSGLAYVWNMLLDGIAALGDFANFTARMFAWLIIRLPSWRTVFPVSYTIGYQSLFVVLITGFFIGMVLAVQTVSQFTRLGFSTWTGSVINVSVIRELGPVLAATMLAGRIGSAMAAELGTMRVNEQIDALSCLGVNPIHYLVVPRFLACVLLIPLLTAAADVAGIVGGALICIRIYGIEPNFYWQHSQEIVQMWDIVTGMIKPIFFGGVIALISCHRGFRSGAGAAGVGRAATEAFVLSFVAILALDFLLAIFLNSLRDRLSMFSV